MLNPFFQQGSKTEQSLVQDLINEQLRMYGVEVHYMPRQFITTNTVIEELIESSFKEAYPIEAYLENVDGYADNSVILSKFGIQSQQEITLTISRERYELYIKPLAQQNSQNRLPERPSEGDLIYFPLGGRLFEIKYVEHEKPFHQLQSTYVYTLRCELFRLEDEVIDTGIDTIDDELVGSTSVDGVTPLGVYGSMMTLNMVGVASTATVYTGLVNGAISAVYISNRGGGYSYAPQVGFSSSPEYGGTGIGTAIMIGGIVVCNKNVDPKDRSVQEIGLINPGFGYTVAPLVAVKGDGTGFAATTGITTSGAVGFVTITSGGSGYTTVPTVTFSSPGSGTTAAATAVINSTGNVESIYLTNAGAGYTIAPTITIAGAGSTSSGTFELNELVTGQTSGTTARVKNWNKPTSVLDVYAVDGSFTYGETIVGSASSASYRLKSVNEFPRDDGFASNAEIESEADAILDFTEQNPFGVP